MMITAAIHDGADLQETTVDRLAALADAGRDQEVREAVALLHPADVAELLDVIERVEIKSKVFGMLFRKYDLLSLPVTDPRGALLGRITIDDVVDVLEEEASEDISKLSGLGQEEPIFDSPLRAIKRRLPWLGLNLVTTSFLSIGLSYFG